MDFTFVGIEQDEVEPAAPPEKTVYPVVHEQSLYNRNDCRIKLVCDEEWEWGCLTIRMADDCDPAPHDHWLTYEQDAVGFPDTMGVDPGDRTVQFMMQYGIAPGQPFWVDATYHCSQDYWGEWDSEVDWDVCGYEMWSLERVCTAWEAYLARTHLIVNRG
jgi:hypothetical protein